MNFVTDPEPTPTMHDFGGIMERRLSSELKDLKSRLLEMGSDVEQAVERATFALHSRDRGRFDEVYRLEDKINEAHMAVDNACVTLLARQSPVAADLRLILAIIKINTDLERMGDQAVNICHNAEHYMKGDALDVAVILTRMSKLVRVMVRKALDAFMTEDVPLAESVLSSDDEVDALRDQSVRDLTLVMKSSPEKVRGALDLILISRNLERLADHATNIAEDVIFAASGTDVRHGGPTKKGSMEE